MEIKSSYWRSRGLHITFRGMKYEFKEILKLLEGKFEVREFTKEQMDRAKVIVDVNKVPLHLHFEIPNLPDCVLGTDGTSECKHDENGGCSKKDARSYPPDCDSYKQNSWKNPV